jgi:hypothetical protein
MPPPTVTLIDVEHVMDGTMVRFTFDYQHDDNLTGATVVPVMMDPTCEERITDDATDMMGSGVRLEPVEWIDAMGDAAMLLIRASVRRLAIGQRWHMDGTGRWCYSRSSNRDTPVLLWPGHLPLHDDEDNIGP